MNDHSLHPWGLSSNDTVRLVSQEKRNVLISKWRTIPLLRTFPHSGTHLPISSSLRTVFLLLSITSAWDSWPKSPTRKQQFRAKVQTKLGTAFLDHKTLAVLLSDTLFFSRQNTPALFPISLGLKFGWGVSVPGYHPPPPGHSPRTGDWVCLDFS